MKILTIQIKKVEIEAEAVKRIIKKFPCVINCKNRAGIKIFTVLLEEILSRAQGNKLHIGMGIIMYVRARTYTCNSPFLCLKILAK